MTEAYRQGFLTKCAEFGVPDAVAMGMLKTAVIGVNGFSLDQAKNLLRSFSGAERGLVKTLIRSEAPGSAGRRDIVRALVDLTKSHRWGKRSNRPFLSYIVNDMKTGSPHVFRGVHNPAEPLHLTGAKTTLPRQSMDMSRTFVANTDTLRHFTPWSDFAWQYTSPFTGMHKTKGGRFGSMYSYRAKDFPAIVANTPNDGFSEAYHGLSKAVMRSKTESERSKILAEKPWLRWTIPGEKPRPGISKDEREFIKEMMADIGEGTPLSDRLWKMKRLMLRERINKLVESGPMDQLNDKYIMKYLSGALNDKRMEKFFDRELESGKLGQKLYEMILDIKGVKPSTLVMTPYDRPGTYIDATKLMRLYQYYATRNKKVADTIGKLFKRRFGYSVE